MSRDKPSEHSSSGHFTDSSLVGETEAAVRAACAVQKERLEKNLRYIIANKERWSIMFHVRSSLSHLARLAFTRLLRRLCADGQRYALRAPGAQSVPILPL